MACTAPLRVYRAREGGPVSFVDQPGFDELELGCGRCMGCRLGRAQAWSVRCQHEASLFDENSFLTLTYDDEHLPQAGSLRYRDVQLFLRRVRKWIAPRRLRFFCAGEYGERTFRPHYHLLLFGLSFDRARDWSRAAPARVSNSEKLDEFWRHGAHHVGTVTAGSIGYCARYALKKVYGRASEDFYTVGVDRSTGEVFERVPEFLRMSLKPGIGRRWYDQFARDVFPCDYVVAGGVKYRVPRYYEKLYSEASELDFEGVQVRREERLSLPATIAFRAPERRAAREEILRGRVTRLDETRSL